MFHVRKISKNSDFRKKNSDISNSNSGFWPFLRIGSKPIFNVIITLQVKVHNFIPIVFVRVEPSADILSLTVESPAPILAVAVMAPNLSLIGACP